MLLVIVEVRECSSVGGRECVVYGRISEQVGFHPGMRK